MSRSYGFLKSFGLAIILVLASKHAEHVGQPDTNKRPSDVKSRARPRMNVDEAHEGQ